MDKVNPRNDWALSTICWYAVFVWFGASLFSQTLYMAFNGTPYDANLLLKSAGPFAWIMIGIEIVVWGFLALVIGGKVANRIQVSGKEITSSEQITPQT
jgi:NhaP-type Na+/H+ or K+/H+ antiporter|tara:strand:+ start:738 stop:1034 length:297 start_codon:yes stop_codon:yes gene_type:complete